MSDLQDYRRMFNLHKIDELERVSEAAGTDVTVSVNGVASISLPGHEVKYERLITSLDAYLINTEGPDGK